MNKITQIKKRTRSRENALQVLYQIDMHGDNIKQSELEEIISTTSNTQNSSINQFATELVRGYLSNREIIDKRIEEMSHNWKIKRMAAVDRNILRLASYELMFRKDIPAGVTINEAIDIAKKFSTVKSGSFINGVLDAIRQKYAIEKELQKQPAPTE